MLKLIDNIWFWILDHAKGYEDGYSEGYDDGHADGELAQYMKTLEALKDKSPDNFSDHSFKLGYLHAIAVIKGDVK